VLNQFSEGNPESDFSPWHFPCSALRQRDNVLRMLRSIAFAFLAALVMPLAARAQLSVQVKMARNELLLYEAVRVDVSIRNFSGRTIELGGQDGAPWLNFLVADEAGATISPVGDPFVPQPVKIEPGHTATLTVDLLSHFDLRQRGIFTVRAAVNAGVAQALSASEKFSIINGREIWKQTIGLPVTVERTNEEYRTYSLQLRRSDTEEVLYVGVQDEAHGLVYGMTPLGEFIPLGEPAVKVDNKAQLHVLYRSGPSSITYTSIDPDAKVLKNVIYSDLLSSPQLISEEDGSVTVHGGEQIYPRIERVMTDAELKPPQPPPTKQRKKKWWWPFGPSNAATTNGVNSASSTNALGTNFNPHS
jgi:hypothetical protein